MLVVAAASYQYRYQSEEGPYSLEREYHGKIRMVWLENGWRMLCRPSIAHQNHGTKSPRYRLLR